MYRRQVCFYHWRLHRPTAAVTDPAYVPPILDSEASIVIASSHILRAVLSGKIDLRRAQVAMSCLRQAAKSFRLQHPVGDHAETSFTHFMADYFSNLDQAQAASSAAYPDPQPLIYPAPFADHPSNDKPLAEEEHRQTQSAADPSSAPAVPVTPAMLSPRQLTKLGEIVRRGRSHPQFNEATRLLDRHIAATSA
jgi:hypothetical protein